MPSYFPDAEDDDVPRRRAGLRSDELLPSESNEDSGSRDAVGTSGGGLSVGGLGGSNSGDGSINEEELDRAPMSGIYDQNGDKQETDEPESGRSGGAAGGTPAGKRAGQRPHDPS